MRKQLTNFVLTLVDSIMERIRYLATPSVGNLRRWQRRGKWLFLGDRFSLAAIAATLFSIFARFDPDPHHDGFQLAPAIGVSEGMSVHRELYSHYGPISAWINGAWLWLTAPSLLNLRLLGAIQLLLTAVLLHSLLCKLAVPRGASWFVTLVWIISCPVWAYESGFFGLWLWPSVTFNLIALAAALVFLRISPQQVGTKRSKIHFCFIGVLLCLALLTRTKEGLVLAIAFFISLAVIHRSVGLFHAVIGFTIIMALFSLLLLLTGSFQEWLDQTIIGPIRDPESVSVGRLDWDYFRSIYLGGNLGATFALLSVLMVLMYTHQRYENRRLTQFLTLVLSISIGYLVLLNRPFSAESSLTYTVVIRFTLLFAVVGVVITVGVILVGLVKKTCAPGVKRQELLVPLALALGAIANLYPLPDIYHLWWASPSLLLFVMIAAERLLQPRIGRAARSIAFSFVVVVVPLNSFKALNETQQPRTEWSDGSLRGMFIHDAVIPSFVAVKEVLNNVDRPADFSNCRDPLWAVFTGTYLSKDEYYAILPSNSNPKLQSGLIIDCGQGRFSRSSNPGVQEISATPDYLNSFSTFAAMDKLTLYEVPDP